MTDGSPGPLASGVVTLLTDFGEDEAYVGVMKGVLLARSPRLRAVVDLTHRVPPQDVAAGAFHLRHAWSWFAPGTVHVAVVDPGVGTSRSILVAQHAGHLFLAPDNGLLDPVLDARAEVHRLDLALFPRPSSTFHGRDLFAPAAARLVEGARLGELGPAVERAALVPLRSPFPKAPAPAPAGTEVHEARVEHVDRFGNLILDLAGAELSGDPLAYEALAGGVVIPFAPAYGAAAPGALLALVDSYGAVEIAVRDGDAARRLALGRGDGVTVRRRT
jgi:hypothetical protein